MQHGRATRQGAGRTGGWLKGASQKHAGMARIVDVLVQPRTAAVDRPLTYLVPNGMTLAIGDVVRVPLGSRQVYGYVVEDVREGESGSKVRPIASRSEGPPAFDAAALQLARWLAEHYCCSLAEALGPQIYGAALPRAVDRFEPAGTIEASRFPGVPARLSRLIAGDLRDGFALETLLRHPEARRAGDRRTLLRALSTLTRAGALKRTRSFVAARTSEIREKFLEASGKPVRGPRAAALLDLVRSEGSVRRRDVLLAGFSHALIARALREGALRETTQRALPARSGGSVENQDFTPTGEQQAAIDALVTRIEAGRFAEVLLQGVTGSGKTLVYIRAIARTLALGGRALVLVPEIALTPQTARRFEGAFGERVAVLHSGLSERERFDSWHAAARGEIDVIVGARSAVFAPLPDLRLIAVDEAHERSYKQDGVPRYNAVDVARERMRQCDGVVVFGSATPPLEIYARAMSGSAEHLRLERRPTHQELPQTHVVDMAAEFERGN